jgi:hypothetical protein
MSTKGLQIQKTVSLISGEFSMVPEPTVNSQKGILVTVTKNNTSFLIPHSELNNVIKMARNLLPKKEKEITLVEPTNLVDKKTDLMVHSDSDEIKAKDKK